MHRHHFNFILFALFTHEIYSLEGTMYQLRLKGLPFTRLNRTKRVYLVKEVLAWIENNKTEMSGSSLVAMVPIFRSIFYSKFFCMWGIVWGIK
jgi:hypothetical protein